MRYTTHRELNDLLERLASEGWTISKGRKHLRLRSPEGGLVFCSFTPSDWRAIKKIEADCRRMRNHGKVQFR